MRSGELVADQLTSVSVGSFRTYLLDQLSGLDSTLVQAKARIERMAEK